MGRAFEYRKAAKLKRWGHMAKTFTRLGKQIAIAVKAGGPEPENNPTLRSLSLLVSVKTCRRIILNVLSKMRWVRTRATIRV
mgnify:CR=1 FL=1